MHIDGKGLRLGRDITSVLIFGFLTSVILCISAPLVRYFPSLGLYWFAGLFVFLTLCSLGQLNLFSRHSVNNSLYVGIVVLYAGLIIVAGAMHALALFLLPHDTIINAKTMDAFSAFKLAVSYSGLYLLFPVMLLSVKGILNQASIISLNRCVLVAGLLTTSIAVFQSNHPEFMPLWTGRVQGLAVDPNALAMIGYLLLPLAIVGVYLDTNRWFKGLFFFELILCVLSVYFSLSRTFAAGMCVFVSLLPAIVALSMVHWRISTRIAIGQLSLLPYIIAVFFPKVLEMFFFALGSVGERLITTLDKFRLGGVHAILNQNELRGEFYDKAISLISLAPWGGWGPAGFYREYSNMFFLISGRVTSGFNDSPMSHYLMIANDYGMPGLLINSLLIFLPLVMVGYVFFGIQDAKLRFLVATLFAANLIFLGLINLVPPSYFLGALWLWVFQLAILLSIAGRYALALEFPERSSARWVLLLICIFLVFSVLAGSYETSFGHFAARSDYPWWKANLAP